MGRGLVAGLICGALTLSATYSAAGQETLAVADAEYNNLWFVELGTRPVAEGSPRSAVATEQARFRQAAGAAGIRYTERRRFSTLFNGFSVEAGAAARARLAALPGVKAIYPVAVIQGPTPLVGRGAAPDLAAAISMTGADIAQNSLGYTGAGIKVAVMDTGVDYHHPDLGGCFGPGCRVAAGWDFVGDAYNADPASADYNPVPTPDADPDDCNGHGTHLAGIIGANGKIRGVAPAVTFGAYRVFGCSGSTTADIMLAAMEQALADGMQVLNISISSPYQWPQYPTARAANRLVNRGIVVVASIGNNGGTGLYSISAPGVGAGVIGAASFDNIAQSLNWFTIAPDQTIIGYSLMTGSAMAPTAGTLPLARTGTATDAADACAPLPAGSLAGMAALIRRGGCTFAIKAGHAQAAGAVAAVIYNNAAGHFNGTIAGSDVAIPALQISGADGVLLDSRLAAAALTLAWQEGVTTFAVPTGGLVSDFSSYGLAPDLAVKPDLGAPGGLVYSTYPLEAGGYATLSGTSMAAPHVAGAAALLREARPRATALAIRGILQNSADPRNWSGNPGLGLLDNVHRQGAGLLDIDDAILAMTRVTPARIAAGESQSGPFTQILKIANHGKTAVTYDLGYRNALSSGGTIAPSFYSSDASVSFSATRVTVPARSSLTVKATINPATGPVNGQYGGYIELTPPDGGQVYRVPFAGFVGDYQGIQVLTGGFPYLGQLTSCALLRDTTCFGTGTYSVFPAGQTYSMVDAYNIPFLLIHLDHQARRVRLEAFDASTGRSWFRISKDEFVGRNSTPTNYFPYAWDGTTFVGTGRYDHQWRTVPDGQYVVKVSVLKALGDENDPAHWETWTSPVITIDRP